MLTKEIIAEASLKLFNAKGLNYVGVRDIARHLGISPGNLAYHFPKKEDLVMYIAEQMMLVNSAAFGDFLKLEKPSLGDMMRLISRLLNNYYDHRGITQDFVELSRMIEQTGYPYAQIARARADMHREIFNRLISVGEIRADAAGLEHLVGFMTFFARFWVVEAFVSFRGKSRQETLAYYHQFAAMQFRMYATAKGRRSLQPWLGAGEPIIS